MRFLLDTDHMSLVQRKTEPEYSTFSMRRAAYPDTDIVSTVVTLHEQLRGALNYVNEGRDPEDAAGGYRRLEELMAFYYGNEDAPPLLPFDTDAATEFARFRKARVRVGTMDLRIASIAYSRGLVVVTQNAKDFEKVPGLVHEDWTRPAR